MIIATASILGPLTAAALILLLRRAAGPLALLGAGVALMSALVTLFRVERGARYGATLPGLPGMPLRLVVDPLAAILSVVVTLVAFLVLLYGLGYMRGERGQERFWAGMSFFAAAMGALVLAGDWVLFLAAWELMGLASYLLIGHYYERPIAGRAATRAFLTTRGADVGLYVGVLLLITRAGTSEIAATLHVDRAVAVTAGLLLLVAAAGKSAQVPFQGWLQDAMAGPTPVSALLHSATLVAAGVVLLVRAFPLMPQGVLLVVGLLGGLTALVAGLTAVAQRDLKRLLAASSSSQLGFMLLALGAGSVGAAILHLVAHAAMKAALFLVAGVFQHARHSTSFDDLRGVGKEHRAAFIAFVIAGLALAGVPPLAGFWSKDAIIAASLESPYAWLLTPLALAGTALTGVYVAQALRLLWRGEGHDGPVDGVRPMGIALACLVVLVALFGVLVGPFTEFLDIKLPKAESAVIASLVAASGGLLLGGTMVAEALPGWALRPAGMGFRVRGGFVDLVVRPALTLAHMTDRLDGRIHSGATAAGRGALAAASTIRSSEALLHAWVEGAGKIGLGLAGASRRTDERGIDALIAALVRNIRELGGRARRLQTGLVHRELALAAGGTGLLLAIVLLSISIGL